MEPTLVLDCSVAMAWCFEDEISPLADSALDRLKKSSAIVPGIWLLEVVNVLLVAERGDRIRSADAARFLTLVGSLPIEIEPFRPDAVLGRIHALALGTGLSSYDAAYLDLAMQRGLPLATLDERLEEVAGDRGVSLFAADD